MENLIKRLQDEAGLTEEQAIVSLEIVMDYMDKEGMKIDWNKFFKGKYKEFKERAKTISNQFSEELDKFSDSFEYGVDGVIKKVKDNVKDISKQVYDKLNDEE